MSKRINSRELVEIGREWERSLHVSERSYKKLQANHIKLGIAARRLAQFINVLIESDPNWGNLAISERHQGQIADAIKEILEAPWAILDDTFEEGGK